jgi:hypothetical protein
LSGTPNSFGPSYFEATIADQCFNFLALNAVFNTYSLNTDYFLWKLVDGKLISKGAKNWDYGDRNWTMEEGMFVTTVNGEIKLPYFLIQFPPLNSVLP